MDTKPLPALDRAIAKYDTLKAFSDAVGVPYQNVQQWRLNGVPPEYCPTIERLSGIPCEELNDKVDWGYVRGTAKPKTPRTSRRPSL